MSAQEKHDVRDIMLSDIQADDEFNCRGEIRPIDVADLMKDIETRGLIQPVVVCPNTTGSGHEYRLVAGFRRYHSHMYLKRDKILCVVRYDIRDEVDAVTFNLNENVQREDLNILQEARAIKRLYDLGLTQEMTAEKTGKSRGWIQVRFMVLELPDVVQQEIAAGIINQQEIRQLYAVNRAAGRESLFKAIREIKDAKLRGRKSTVRVTKKIDNETKKPRTRTEIFAMIEHISTFFGFSITTRSMAWAAGEITTAELYNDLEALAKQQEKHYYRPVAV